MATFPLPPVVACSHCGTRSVLRQIDDDEAEDTCLLCGRVALQQTSSEARARAAECIRSANEWTRRDAEGRPRRGRPPKQFHAPSSAP